MGDCAVPSNARGRRNTSASVANRTTAKRILEAKERVAGNRERVRDG